MNIFHYTNYNQIDESVIGFSKYCRENGLNIGLNHSQEALTAAKKGIMEDKSTMKYALKALFCTCEEEHDQFNKCFEVFWGVRKHSYSPTISKKIHTKVEKKTNASLVLVGFNPNGDDKKEDDKEEAKNVTGSSQIEALKSTDFSKVSAIDSPILDRITEQLLKQLNHRLKRKFESSKKGKIDLRKTIRNNLSNGDLLLELSKKSRKLEKYRLILLLDVSGSMDKYSFFLLKFIWSLKTNLKNIEAFVFSTKLIRITDFLHQKELDETLWQMSHHADNWSSGTKIGECLQSFNDQFSKRILNGKSITIVLSDGLDNGDSDLLAQELRKIRLRTSKLVWLNPLKGTKGYQPTAKGMKAAKPEVDAFESAHNLNSLLELENILANV
jgi:uncharacterized protein